MEHGLTMASNQGAFLDYQIQGTDTLESIAARLLNNASAWRRIAVLNKLRAPYISVEPIDQYGTPIVAGTVTTEIAAGSTSYTFLTSDPIVYGSTYQAGTVFFCVYYEYLDAATRSLPKYDAMVLASTATDGSGSALTFLPTISVAFTSAITSGMLPQTVAISNQTNIVVGSKITVDSGAAKEVVTVTAIPDNLSITAVFANNHVAGTTGIWGFTNTYPTGTQFFLFPPTAELTTKVLRPGDFLHVPGAASSASTADTVGSAAYISLLGSDVQLGQDGALSFDSNGDLVLVAGTGNVKQAIRNRLNTPAETLPHHPTYGNPLFDFIAHNSSPYYINLATGLLRSTILDDPRVSDVTLVKASQVGATLNVDAQVKLARASSILRVDNLLVRV
jgi:hypothetical protein